MNDRYRQVIGHRLRDCSSAGNTSRQPGRRERVRVSAGCRPAPAARVFRASRSDLVQHVQAQHRQARQHIQAAMNHEAGVGKFGLDDGALDDPAITVGAPPGAAREESANDRRPSPCGAAAARTARSPPPDRASPGQRHPSAQASRPAPARPARQHHRRPAAWPDSRPRPTGDGSGDRPDRPAQPGSTGRACNVRVGLVPPGVHRAARLRLPGFFAVAGTGKSNRETTRKTG